MKKRRLLLDEFKAGIWTRAEYQREVRELDGRPTPAATESSAPTNSSQSPQGSLSPRWRIEDDDELLEVDDNLSS